VRLWLFPGVGLTFRAHFVFFFLFERNLFKMAEAALPDLHHKMSKKVAQLTKVIYHLNAKNEEHDLELNQLADQYENEIDTIMKDASAKLNEFRRQLDIKKEEASYQAALDKCVLPLCRCLYFCHAF
jgi:uncharacterized protein Yka (UPF0111/DUF47 family)